MIIFDKFGDGQSERNRSVPFFPNDPMRTVTRVSPLRLLALTKEGTKEGTKEPHLSGMSERLSRPALAVPSATLTSRRIADSLRKTRAASQAPRTPISNRELDLLERHLSHCKQRKATVSNRELSTVENAQKIVNLVPFWISEIPFRAPISDRNFHQPTTFLP